MDNFNDDWWQWRHAKDTHEYEQDKELGQINVDIAVIKTRQDISILNDNARHSRTPTIALGLLSGAVSLIVLVMQILAWRAGAP